jgi:antirestriction protein ArdC
MSHQPARTDPYQLVTASILAHLERGVVPWRCPWNRNTGRPRNFHTGRAYHGINVLLLGLLHFPSPWWMTFRQTQERGGSIRKGEHGAVVMKFGSYDKATRNGDGTEDKKTTLFLKSYRVFNASQIEGVEFPPAESVPQFEPLERIARAEQILTQMPQPPTITEGRSTRACYRPQSDTIEMPALTRFHSPEEFHLTLFHELIHSTGHPSRLARKGVTESDGFGGKSYTQEELVAEMGAAFLGMEAEIVRDEHEQSAAYLQAWLATLRVQEHRRWIVQAGNQAGRAADFILGRSAEKSSSAPATETTAGQPALPSVARFQ